MNIKAITDRQWEKIIVGGIIALCLAWVIVWILALIQNVNFPQIDYSEGFNMWNVSLFGSGDWEWNALAGPPYNDVFYPPVSYILMGIFTKPFGYSLIAGRVFYIIVTAGCLITTYFIVRHYVQSKVFALIGAILPLMNSIVVAFSFIVRVDMLAVLFELLGFYLFIKYEKTKFVYLSLIVFVLAFFTKQTAVAGMVAAVIYLFFTNRRTGIIYSGLYICSIGIIFLCTNTLTHGEFYRQIVLYQGMDKWNSLFNVLYTTVLVTIYIIPVAYFGLIHINTKFRSPTALYALAAFIINGVTVFHIGGTMNYLLEAIFALSIAAAITIPSLMHKHKLMIAVIFLFPVVLLITFVPNLKSLSPDYTEKYNQAVAIIKDATYPVLTENAGIVLAAGKKPYYEPFVYKNMYELGYFDDSVLINDLETGHIEYVIADHVQPYAESYRFHERVQDAIVDNYHIVLDNSESDHGFVVYERNEK